MNRFERTLSALFAGVLVGGCEGLVAAPAGPHLDRAVSGAGDDPITANLICNRETETLGPSVIHRLTRTEYLNTVADLFPGTDVSGLSLPTDAETDGFDNNAKTQAAYPLLVDAYFASAKTIARSVASRAGELTGCGASDAACASQYAQRLAARAYRRPLESDEQQAFATFMTDGTREHGLATALELFISGLLQSPNFLYRPELGVAGDVEGEGTRLSGYEVASRLSYFLYESMPDEALIAAAERGELDTAEGVERVARAMLDDPRARASIAHFTDQWLGLSEIETMRRDIEMYPMFHVALPELLAESTRKLLEHHFWEGDATVASLLVEPQAFVNDELAALYGVAAPGTSELTLVELDPNERAGFLTQAGLMASLAHEQLDAPILRGNYVLRRFLCSPPPPPPPNIPAIDATTASDGPMTTRDRVEKLHEKPGCISCHKSIDGIGFAFGGFDAVGQHRTLDNGLPINATGSIEGIGDVSGEFDGAVELSQMLADSETVQICAARHLYRFGVGHTETNSEACGIVDALEASGGNMREMLVHIALSPTFRFRRTEELAP